LGTVDFVIWFQLSVKLVTDTLQLHGPLKRLEYGQTACLNFGSPKLPTRRRIGIKNADTAGPKGYDAGKKVSGIKRHIDVDTQGFPHAVTVTTADVTDRQGALQAFERCKTNLHQVKSVLADGGDTGEPFAQGVREPLGEQVTLQIAKRSELHTFKMLPKRWVVERNFAWLKKNRRLSKNHGRWLNTSLQFVHLAFLALLLRRS
jgi:transposase